MFRFHPPQSDRCQLAGLVRAYPFSRVPVSLIGPSRHGQQGATTDDGHKSRSLAGSAVWLFLGWIRKVHLWRHSRHNANHTTERMFQSVWLVKVELIPKLGYIYLGLEKIGADGVLIRGADHPSSFRSGKGKERLARQRSFLPSGIFSVLFPTSRRGTSSRLHNRDKAGWAPRPDRTHTKKTPQGNAG